MAKDKLHTFVVTVKLEDIRRLMNAFGTTDADALFGTLIKYELQRLRFRPQIGESDDGTSASKQ